MLLQFASFQAALWVAVGWAGLGRQNYKHERWPFISDFHPLQVQIYSFGVMKLTFLFTKDQEGIWGLMSFGSYSF